MRSIGISFFIILLNISVLSFDHIFTKIPKELNETDYIFVVEIKTQTNYLFYKKTLIDQFSVSTGSRTRYKGNREMKEGIWRLSQRISKNLAPIYGARLIYLDKYNQQKKEFFRTNKAFHGTNEPFNIGKPTSMGCVYHFDEDILDIYSYIPKHTLVITVKNV
ncbi:MAG: L,D-transpeptidase [Candidatus Margulisiibacteriota bacterium]